MSKIFEQLCSNRGITSDFLNPKYENLQDPFILPSMPQAIERINKAIKNHEKIIIYGDYDADGVTASTLMEEALILAGAQPENLTIMLPDRFADGYGMSPRLVQAAKDQSATLVITVDCGSRNHEIVDKLNELDIDSIITDHHETAAEMPAAIAVINPHRKDAPTPSLQNLAGVGVAFKLVQAMTQQGMIKEGQEKWLLDLVILGTICDSMTLTGENRILGRYGLIVLAKTRRPGLRELMRRAGVKKLNSESIGFQIGPRINAAGRLESAHIALDLLRARTEVDAAPIAEKIEQLNKKRKSEQLSITSEIDKQGIGDDPVIIKAGDSWHEGVLGIVAGRLVENYHRPAFVLTHTSDGFLKGSGRSFGEFNLVNALNDAKDIIVGGGGHAAAAGVRLEQDNLDLFRTKINDYYRSLHLTEQEKYLKKSADLTLSDFSELSLDLLKELSTLEPFGAGNEEPIFRLQDTEIINVVRMGAERNHLRLDLQDKSGKSLKCLAFFAPEDWLNLTPEDKIEPIIRFIENDFNGVKSLEAMIIDIVVY